MTLHHSDLPAAWLDQPAPDPSRPPAAAVIRAVDAAKAEAARDASLLPVPSSPPPRADVERYLRSWAPVDPGCAALVAEWDATVDRLARTGLGSAYIADMLRRELNGLTARGLPVIAAFMARHRRPSRPVDGAR